LPTDASEILYGGVSQREEENTEAEPGLYIIGKERGIATDGRRKQPNYRQGEQLRGAQRIICCRAFEKNIH